MQKDSRMRASALESNRGTDVWNPLVTDFGDTGESEPRQKWKVPDWAIVPSWILLPAALFVARYWTLHLSSFGWYHGFNEAVYTEIAANYLNGESLPTRGGALFFDTGPLTPWLMALTYDFLNPWPGNQGAEEAAVRLGVLLAYPFAVWAAYMAGNGFYGRGKGKIAAILVATSPWVLLWFGRAQTDAWMVTGILLYLAGLSNPTGRKGAALIVSGLVIALLSKQPAVLVLAAVPFAVDPRDFRSADKQRVLLLTALGVILGLTWWVLMAWQYPAAFGSSVEFHVEDRAEPFGNWMWTLFLGLVVGAGGLLFMAWKARKPNVALAVTGGAFAFFALWNSPIGHEYYSLPAVAILCIMAANWKWDKVTLSACVVISLALTAGLLAYTGDLDDTQTRDMGYAISVGGFYNGTYPVLDQNVSVIAPDRLVPQLHIYSGGRTVNPAGLNHSTEGFIISWDLLDCPQMYETAKTMSNPPLRLFDCRVS